MRILVLLIAFLPLINISKAQPATDYKNTSRGHVVSDEGAWCWFADPRAYHYENENGTIKNTYIGYIDVHGNIKATQYNHLTDITNEVLVRSWFQPDDHNNPTFLALPDDRIMIFYSRHTDESCFYYRISKKPGDITTLGEEKKLLTENNTTYPSPFILSDDPDHIYLTWRGINWHPTIARLTMPDENDDVAFNQGPFQIVSYPADGARPYAKYASNGKDKIYMTFTTTHPDNQSVNFVYYSYIDIDQMQLKDVKNNVITNIDDGPHTISTSADYTQKYPNMVVDNSPNRNWIWQVSHDGEGKPVIATVRIDESKTSHDYYYARWTGDEWENIFLANAGGHFHQSPEIEHCYSGGMTLDDNQPNNIYCSVPINGKNGEIYEIIKYNVGNNGSVSQEQVTLNSSQNNVRPYLIPNSEKNDLRLTWMHGKYYDWIVSSQRPEGFPTEIHSNVPLPTTKIDLSKGLIKSEDFSNDNIKGNAVTKDGVLRVDKKTSATIMAPSAKSFSVSITALINHDAFGGEIVKIGPLTYGIEDNSHPLPYIKINEETYRSSNVLGNSDTWKSKPRATNGQWYEPVKPGYFNLTITYHNNTLRTYIDGLIDQSIEIKDLELDDVILGGFKGKIDNCHIYNRALSQDEIKHKTDNWDKPRHSHR
ncbi:MAG: BNR-4 repeat-containing protein [Marinilabilia sp.]